MQGVELQFSELTNHNNQSGTRDILFVCNGKGAMKHPRSGTLTTFPSINHHVKK